MPTLDPIATSRRIEESYRRYLRSTLQPRNPEMRNSFERQLERPENRLAKGPLLQAAAPYTQGASVAELIADGVLADGLAQLPAHVFPANRPLYTHQEEAICKLVAGENVLVATGTGSGKTESFLLPIMSALLHERSEGTLHQPGVRAMLLYPMNALANDQLKRLRLLLQAFPDITFGRYTGESDDTREKALSRYRELNGDEPLPNELISRQEIIAHPPHLLITNFAMLEYLLLRPRDSELFDGATGSLWKFLVLDEIHVYDGAKGAEIGYLLRRLRDRVVASERGRLTCVGTSATLGAGEEASAQLVTFAGRLFDEPFSRSSLVLPSRVRLDNLESEWSITDDQVARLLALVDGGCSGTELAAAAGSMGCPPVESTDEPAATLGRLLRSERRVVDLRRRLGEGSIDVAELRSHEVFTDDQSLVALVELAWRAVDADGQPLLPARYHLLLRSLEGAFVCADPQHPTPDRLFLQRRLHCPECLAGGRKRQLFEFGACRRCGAEYVIGSEDADEAGNRVLAAAPLHERNLVNLLLGEPEVDDDEEDQVEDSEDNITLSGQQLCCACGVYSDVDHPVSCCADRSIRQVTLLRPGKGGVVRKCGACSRHAPSNIVYRFLSGADAAGAVIASTLYQDLPVDPHPAVDAVAGGRKLLTFSDSRQEAAFFAGFMQRTHDQANERRLMWEALRLLQIDHPLDAPRFEDLVPRLVQVAERFDAFPPIVSRLGRGDVVRTWLFSEVLSTDTAQNLEGVGLASITPAVPVGLVVPDGMIPQGMTSADVVELVVGLLSSLRTRNCVRLPQGVSIDDVHFSPRNFLTHVRGVGADSRVIAWSPGPSYRNARLDLVERVFARLGVADDARVWLASVWGWLTAPASPWKQVLPSVNDPRLGVMHHLNYEMLEFVPVGELATPRQCDTCRTIAWRALGGVCARTKCQGQTHPLAEPLDDHYRFLYTSIDPVQAVVEEHTAQLTAATAAERQMKFVRGAVNVLSSSTTFELGVDVGEIQAVFMRNMPPSPANYVQRAGRAGRRSGSPALVVTLALRRNHDQHFFTQPLGMIDGQVKPPVIKIDNHQIARRHVHAVALSAFLREWVDSGHADPTSVEQFFEAESTSGTSVVDAWTAWMRARPAEVQAALRRILPDSVAAELKVDDWGWVHQLADAPVDGEGGWLHIAVNGVLDMIAELEAEKQRLIDKQDLRSADHVQRVQSLFRSTKTISELARRIILPKYGFPVDTVPLDLSRLGTPEAARLELDRDLSLAIVEYAPGNQVVADKLLWESVGLRIPRGLQLPSYSWRICGNCGALTSKLAVDESSAPEACGVCGSDAARRRGRFVWPLYGFIGEAKGKAGDQRPQRTGNAEAHFLDYGVPPTPRITDLNGQSVEVIESRHGEIQLINSGPRGAFRLCRSCGRAEVPPEAGARKGSAGQWKHQRPGTNVPCGAAAFSTAAIGHRYRTDVLEIRLTTAGSEASYLSTLQALLAGLSPLGIHRSDVRGMLRTYRYGMPQALVLVDAVPGGAGHAQHIAEQLQELVNAAYDRVARCTCGIDTSCYGCLRSYENQYQQDHLTRQGALDVLRPYVSAP
jgi:ATP-dependent helicase YprA (DUF1998 family)